MPSRADDQVLAIRYGQECRRVFADCSWDQCEDQVRRHWALIDGETTWSQARPAVLQGWQGADAD